jgi:hypothetical protein
MRGRRNVGRIGRRLRRRLDGASSRRDLEHPAVLEGRTAVRPTNASKASQEDSMSRFKLVRTYARYIATSFATIGFRIVSN